MAELTEEQKIIIGVCVGVAGLILIAILVFICCIFHLKNKRRRRNGYKDKLVVDRYDRYDRHPYPVYEKSVPPIMYDLPPPPPPPPPPPMWREPPPMWREPYYKKPRSIEPVVYKYDTWDRRSDPPRKYYSDNRWDGVYRNDPIVVPMADPEYVQSGPPRREADTIYLKYVDDRYVDDHALLPRTNYSRRPDYGNLRRTRSFHDVRRSTPYVGEWGRRPDNVNEFNEYAMRAGRDPFLWK